jgi:hypothetical protein
MEPAEADTLLNSMTPHISQLSPRRKIQVSQTVTPGGTRVTTTTMTTQKPQLGRMEPAYNRKSLQCVVLTLILMLSLSSYSETCE